MKTVITRYCLNPRCRDRTNGRLCPSCQFALRSGLFAGGVIGGLVVALVKAFA